MVTKDARPNGQKPELMAPAGDRVGLMAALDAGADAVYFGIGTFNMRANAGNFSLRQLPEIVSIIHQARARAYLTLNTLMLPQDLQTLRRTVKEASEAGVDAIIAWDFAAIDLARQAGLQVFVSTQMSVANHQAILFFYRTLGIRRFVLARECSLADIRSIRRSLREELGEAAAHLELEVFVHGAMCLSMSGRCQLSQFHFGTSANRGLCRQPCRREFTVTETRDQHSFQVGSHYILSPKDICTLPFLEKLLSAGINSLKIEGRQRAPEYVAIVTRAYRRIIDLWYDSPRTPKFKQCFAEAKEEEMRKLEQVFHRGFSSGFYLGKPLDAWNRKGGSEASHRKHYLGLVENYFKKLGVASISLEGGSIAIGDEIMIHGPTTGVKAGVISSIQEDGKPLDHAAKGTSVGIAFPHLVRGGDKVYRLIPLLEKQAQTATD